MKKATFIPLENKKDEAALSKQQRIDRMFELIEATALLQKKYVFIPPKNSITLKRKK